VLRSGRKVARQEDIIPDPPALRLAVAVAGCHCDG
jgi:hypothetical protein